MSALTRSLQRWTPERRARAALSCAVEAGNAAVARQVGHSGAEYVWRQACTGGLGAGAAERAARIDIDQLVRRAGLQGIRFVVPGDEEWTDRLVDLDRSSDQTAGGSPLGLWLRGPVALAAGLDRAVALVGARACTAYGEGVAADLAAGLADLGLPVLSGGAYGIDAAAHRGALSAGGVTAAVLACGVDVAYPRGNSRLLERLAVEQLLVSELPPGAHPTRSRFLTRNRLIAALSVGVVVVEAALRSGARNTATWASTCSRPLMAVPGPVHSALSETPHLMIREQQAVLVSTAAEVAELVSPAGHHLVVPRHGEVRPTDRLSRERLAVYEALPARRIAATGEIGLASGLPVQECLAELVALEEAGLVRSEPAGWRLA